MKNSEYQILLNHVSKIREERDTQKRMEMLLKLNDSLPESLRLDVPSLITNAYVRRALDLIEERASLSTLRGNTLTSAA